MEEVERLNRVSSNVCLLNATVAVVVVRRGEDGLKRGDDGKVELARRLRESQPSNLGGNASRYGRSVVIAL